MVYRPRPTRIAVFTSASDRPVAFRTWLVLPDPLAQADPAELRPIGSSPHLWAELRWACAEEAVETLGDLLLRRTRLGLLLPDGAAGVAESIRRIAQPALGWDDARWAREYARYREHWQQYHAPPTAEVI